MRPWTGERYSRRRTAPGKPEKGRPSPPSFFPRPSSLSRKPISASLRVWSAEYRGSGSQKPEPRCGSLSEAAATLDRPVAKKVRTPAPPRRPVQAPKVRTGKPAAGAPPSRGVWVLLLAFGGSGFVLLGAVLVAVFVFNVGRSSKSNTPAASTQLSAGFTLKT